MEAKVNTSCHARTLVQVISPVPGRLGCMYRALGYLSGMLIKVLARVVSLISSLCEFSLVSLTGLLTGSFIKQQGVTERKTVVGFRKKELHDRRHALFRGSSKKRHFIK